MARPQVLDVRRGVGCGSHERVVAAAVALADARGIAAVTMRAVGGRLGIEAMSLYHHLDHDAHPELTAHVRWHLDQPPGPSGDAFELGLDLLLEGLERLRTAG